MTILNVAYPFAPVGPAAVGGAEQVLTQIDEALVRAGETSLVLACAESRAFGRHFKFDPCLEVLDEVGRRAAHLRYRAMLEKILEEQPVDLVHMHGIDFAEYLPRTELPILVTLHLPLLWYTPPAIENAPSNVYFHCVSASQRRGYATTRSFLPEIENGVDLRQLAPRVRKATFASAIGRICPEKGFHHALRAARDADVPMLLAGKVFPYRAHQFHYEQEVQPLLDNRRRFIGPVGPIAKTRLLGASRCLLVPSLAPETSSLVAMEALACGTPVIAFAAGALAEIVEDGVTGFLVKDEQSMAEGIRRAGDIDPETCRARALERFSLERTTSAYLSVYRKLIARTLPFEIRAAA